MAEAGGSGDSTNLYKVHTACIMFPNSTTENGNPSRSALIAGPQAQDIQMDLKRIEIRRDLFDQGCFFTVELLTSKLDFIPPQSVIGIQLRDLKDDKSFFGVMGIVYAATGTVPTNEVEKDPSKRLRRTIRLECVDVWSALCMTKRIRHTFINQTLQDMVNHLKSEVSQIPDVFSGFSIGKIDFNYDEVENTNQYEYLTIPSMTYLQALKNFNNNYGFFNSLMVTYAEIDTLSDGTSGQRYMLFSSFDRIITENSTVKKININIGQVDPGERTSIGQKQSAGDPTFYAAGGNLGWSFKGTSITDQSVTVDAIFTTPDNFFEEPKSVNLEDLDVGLQFPINLQKFGDEFTFGNTETSQRSKMNKNVPRITINLNMDSWKWKDFRPGTLAQVKINDGTTDQAVASVIDGKWCITNNEVAFEINGINAMMEYNRVSLTTNYTKVIDPTIDHPFDPGKTQDEVN